MSHVTAQDVIRDIEFEIAQGLVVRQDLRQAIHAVKKFHSKTRREVFGPDGKAADLREIASRQFQINDMLITLLEEVTTAACSAQLEAQRTSRVLQRALASSLLIDPPSGPDTPSGENSSDGMMDTAVDDIVEAMQPEDIAECIVFTLTRPLRVNVDEIVVKALAQTSGGRIVRS